MAKSTILSLLLASGLGHALPSFQRSPFAVKERNAAHHEWIEDGPADRAHTLDLHIGLRQSTEGVVEHHLEQISDPAHERYGKYLTAAEVDKLVAPTGESIDLVQAWLADHDISVDEYSFNRAQDWISLTVSVEQAERMLDTTYSTFRHEDGSSLIRTQQWSLPMHLHQHIDVIQPTTSFLRPHGATLHPDQSSRVFERQEGSDSGAATDELSADELKKYCGNHKVGRPNCTRALYGTLNYTAQAAEKNSISHANLFNQTSFRKDIKKFLKKFRPEAAGVADTFPIRIVADASDDQSPYKPDDDGIKNLEGTFDSEIILSIAWPTPFEGINVGGKGPWKEDRGPEMVKGSEPYLRFQNYLLDRDDPPHVISISYGGNEQTVPEAYARRVCSGFAQLGARGISVLTSSGDFGVGQAPYCVSNDGTKTRKFLPHFPASCPWVTAVGGTSGWNPEVAPDRYASGGGFSDFFAAPAYQKQTTDAYVASLDGLHDGLYNAQGRGYPDVSAQSFGIAGIHQGYPLYGAGTSAAAPAFGAVIALVNDALLAQDRPVLGFLNPWLYDGAREALTDIINGSSYGCKTDGFPAQVGWDAVTGLGTPKFSELVQAAFESAEGYGKRQL